MEKKLTCIICPRGCELVCNKTQDGFSVSGNACVRGEKYAIDECTNPTRTLTSIIRVSNRPDTMVSVKTDKPINKGDILSAMDKISAAAVEAPIRMGQMLIEDLFGAGVVATKEIE